MARKNPILIKVLKDAGVPPELAEQVQVCSEEEAEASDFVACVPASVLMLVPDNVITECVDCRIPVQHRPYAPKKPPKVCLTCAMKRVEINQASESS